MAIYVPQGRQFSSLYGNRRIPYRAFIESQIPSLYARRKYQEDKELADRQLALERENLDLSGRELDESTRQSEESLALQRELAGESGKQAKLGLGIGAANTAITGAYLGKKLGLGKKVAGLFGKESAAPTASKVVASESALDPAVSAGVGAAGVGSTIATAVEGGAGAGGLTSFGMTKEAVDAAIAGKGAGAGLGAGAGAGTGIGLAITAPSILGPPLTKWGHSEFSRQTAPGAGNYLNVLKGKGSGSGWDANAMSQLDNLLSGYAANPSNYTQKPERQVQEWLTMQKYGQRPVEEGGSGMTANQWRNQTPLSEAEDLLNTYKQLRGLE